MSRRFLGYMIKKLFYTILVLCLLACIAAAGGYYWLVIHEPGDEITQENIRKILGRESPVFYSDGVTPLGVFFADAHRQYIEYAEIPPVFINALVAAEDNRFFSHFGFDVIGITRAAIKNIQARRVVQGGSTLTQQTAKNLFKRKDRSLQAKLKELLYALRLEYHYSKEQILEFYSNQFYVSGNGLGLGVAARYYFDKQPSELTLLEAAYIAGSVKRPNYYNPFIKRNEEGAEKAKQRGRARVDYVLKNMRKLEMIDEAEYRNAAAAELAFNKGDVGYELDYVMELVTEAVGSDRVVDELAAYGIENIATSGIRIITTVDKDVQSDTLYALRRQLSYLDVRLRGYEREEVQAELVDNGYQGDLKPEVHAFMFGVVRSIRRESGQTEIDVYFGRKTGSGVIDSKGLERLVDARTKWQEHRWSEAAGSDFDELVGQLKEGDRVWVSIREKDENNRLLLDLERFPLVQGGAIILQKGRIMGVAGGVENRFFNRAIYGRRTMGSSYKPFLFAAALQLGWNAADLLQNKRDVFVYQNQAYFPRPDHTPESDTVSMSWAGVRSENLASVWLAKHLCDHLTRSRLTEVAAHVGLAPKIVDGEKEPYRLFRSRIRDKFGLVIDQDVVRKAAYRKTVGSIEPDLVFEGLESEYEQIKNLHYGLGFQMFALEIKEELAGGKGGQPLADYEIKELKLRKEILSRNFIALSELRRELRKFLNSKVEFQDSLNFTIEETISEAPGLYYDRGSNRYIFDFPENLPEYISTINNANLQQYLMGLSEEKKNNFIQEIQLGGHLSVKAFDFLDSHVDMEFQRMRKLLPYSMEILEHVDDYRTMIGLNYLVALGRTMGIESSLEPVLSFPLGSNVTTLIETTRLYEAMATGDVHLFRETNGEINNTLAIIDRIESEDGVLLYQPAEEKKIVIDPDSSLSLGHILENTVKFGTGRYADQHVRLSGDAGGLDGLSLSVPLLGKTGTANRYTNASFFGYLPALNEEGNGMVIDGGYGIGVYVGYDNNQVMRRRTTRITGAAGALPAWTDIVNSLLRKKSYETEADPIDLSFYGLVLRRENRGQLNLAVVPESGGGLIEPAAVVDEFDRYKPSIMTFGVLENGSFTGERTYKPFWKQETVENPVPVASLEIVEKDL